MIVGSRGAGCDLKCRLACFSQIRGSLLGWIWIWKARLGLVGLDGVTTICVKLQLLMSYSVQNSLLFYDYKPLNLLLVKIRGLPDFKVWISPEYLSYLGICFQSSANISRVLYKEK